MIPVEFALVVAAFIANLLCCIAADGLISALMIEPVAISNVSFVAVASLSAVIVISDDPCTTAFPIAGIAASNTVAVTPPPLSIVSTVLKFVPLVNV